MLATKGPKGAADFAQEALALVFVDAHDFVEQAEIVSALAGDGAEGHNIFRKTRSAVADAGIEEAGTDAGVGADSVAHLAYVRAHSFADGGDGVDERNLHGKKSIGGVLDQFRALGAGDDDGSGDGGAIGLRDGIGLLVVRAAGKRRVNFAEHGGATVVVAADEDTVGEEKIGDSGAFAEELGVGGDVERIGIGAVAQNNFAHPFAGIDGDSAFFDDDFIAVDGAGDFAGHGFDIGKVGIAAIGGRGSDGDENGGAGAHGGLQISGEGEAVAAMAA